MKLFEKWEKREKIVKEEEEYSELWDLVVKNRKDEKMKEQVKKKKAKKWERMVKILADWEESDQVYWLKAVGEGRKEVRKIAAEYLEGGTLETVPLSLERVEGHNLTLESSFAITKDADTKKHHRSVMTLEGAVMQKMNTKLPSIELH